MKLVYAAIIIQSVAVTLLSVLVGMDMAYVQSDIKFLYKQALISQNHTLGVLEIVKIGQALDEHQSERLDRLEGVTDSRFQYYNPEEFDTFRLSFVSACSNDFGASTTIWPDGTFACHIGQDNVRVALPNIKTVSEDQK